MYRNLTCTETSMSPQNRHLNDSSYARSDDHNSSLSLVCFTSSLRAEMATVGKAHGAAAERSAGTLCLALELEGLARQCGRWDQSTGIKP